MSASDWLSRRAAIERAGEHAHFVGNGEAGGQPQAEPAHEIAVLAARGSHRPAGAAEDAQPAAHFVERRRTLMADLVGLPGRLDLAAKRGDHLVAFRKREVGPIVLSEKRGDAVVLVDHRPARHLGWMRGEHQLNVQAADRVMEVVWRDAAGQEARERLFA